MPQEVPVQFGCYAAAHDSHLRPMTMPTTTPTIAMKLTIRSTGPIVLE